MKLSISSKAFALALAIGAFGFAGGAAKAYEDDPNPGDVVTGIIGEVIGGAIEAERRNEEAREHARRCARWQGRCEEGADWACRKVEYEC